MSEWMEYVRDRWENDSHWRSQISLVVIVSVISLLFTIAEVKIKQVAN